MGKNKLMKPLLTPTAVAYSGAADPRELKKESRTVDYELHRLVLVFLSCQNSQTNVGH